MTMAAFALLLALPTAGLAGDLASGTGKPRQTIDFTLEWPPAEVPKYTVVVDQRGTGYYWEKDPELDSQGEPIATKLSIGTDTLKTIFATKDVIAGDRCETHIKNIAQTGKKTLTYSDNDQTMRCIFNFSDEDRVNKGVAALQAIAETIQMGQHLQHAHRFDRLGLDAQVDFFASEIKDGRAIEVQNIAPILQSIVDDERVMERVRRKTARVLQDAGVASAPLAASPR